MPYWVYILASQRNGTLYTGVTSDINRRVFEHKNKQQEGFTQKHDVTTLVYAEQYVTAIDAITREKQLKWWERSWKIALIESVNPLWIDLYGK
jgi:putative endonuclease